MAAEDSRLLIWNQCCNRLKVEFDKSDYLKNKSFAEENADLPNQEEEKSNDTEILDLLLDSSHVIKAIDTFYPDGFVIIQNETEKSDKIKIKKIIRKILLVYLKQSKKPISASCVDICALITLSFNGDFSKSASLNTYVLETLDTFFHKAVNEYGDNQFSLEMLFLSEICSINLKELCNYFSQSGFDVIDLLSLTRHWCQSLFCLEYFPLEFSLNSMLYLLIYGPSILITISFEIINISAESIVNSKEPFNLHKYFSQNLHAVLTHADTKINRFKFVFHNASKILKSNSAYSDGEKNLLQNFAKYVSWNFFLSSDHREQKLSHVHEYTKKHRKNKKRKKRVRVLKKALEKPNEEEINLLFRGVFHGETKDEKPRNFYLSNRSYQVKFQTKLQMQEMNELVGTNKKTINAKNSSKFKTKDFKDLGMNKNSHLRNSELPLEYEKVSKRVSFPCILMQGWLYRKTKSNGLKRSWFYLEEKYFGYSKEPKTKPKNVVDVTDAEVTKKSWGEDEKFSFEILIFIEKMEDRKGSLRAIIRKFKTMKIQDKTCFQARSFELIAETREEAEKWLRALSFCKSKI